VIGIGQVADAARAVQTPCVVDEAEGPPSIASSIGELDQVQSTRWTLSDPSTRRRWGLFALNDTEEAK
jgi:hypothetical protein